MIIILRRNALRTPHLIGTARPPAASTHFTYAAAIYDLPGHLWQACTAYASHEDRGAARDSVECLPHAALSVCALQMPGSRFHNTS